jgi:thioredoxin reductase (NADPH)
MEKVIIVGSGPAGLTAAIYTSRAMLNPLMFEGYGAGGQLMTTTEVDNYPGFPKGILGPDLMQDFRKQAERFGTRLVTKDVTRVDLTKRPFTVWVGEETHQSESVIIATGASAKLIGLDAEKKLMGRGVSTCATCDGAFFKNQEVLIVGGGDTAMEEAIFLTRFASKVTVVHRREKLRASAIMQEKAMANSKIAWVWNSVIEKIEGENEVTGAILKNVVTGDTRKVACQAVFVAIGHTPNTQLFHGQIKTDENGYIVTHEGSKTSVDGVFACGDVQDHVYRQAITAAGSGCMAAIDCSRWLEHHGKQ